MFYVFLAQSLSDMDAAAQISYQNEFALNAIILYFNLLLIVSGFMVIAAIVKKYIKRCS